MGFASSMGLIPMLLEKAYGKQKDKISALESENAALRDAQSEQGKLVGMKKGGKVSSASKRADGCATKGKTRGRMV